MAKPHLQMAATELDSVAATGTDSLATTEESVRFMCSFGGKILPRPHDNQLRYVGGDTRIVSFHRRSTSFPAFLAKLSRLARTDRTDTDTNCVLTVKYQLPNEDLDSLITLASDEDLENMMDEHDRNPSSRLRVFLFPNDPVSRTSSISSLLDGSTKRQNWFLDALNGGPGSGSGPVMEKGRSEASSMVSEVPDYLFGLDNTDDKLKPKPKFDTMIDTVLNSDPGSPAPVISSPYCSASSCTSDLTSVKVRPNVYQVENFVPDVPYQSPGLQHIPVYYIPGSNIPVHAVQVRAPYAQPFQPIPIRYNDPRTGMGQVYQQNVPSRVINSDNMNQPVYYRNPYTGMVVTSGEDLAVIGADRVNQPR